MITDQQEERGSLHVNLNTSSSLVHPLLSQAASEAACPGADPWNDQERQQHEEEVEHNHGVWWQATLVATLSDGAAGKGVKRSSDKVSHLKTLSSGGTVL